MFIRSSSIEPLQQVKNKFAWFIRFTVFCVPEYCFHDNPIILFFIVCSGKNSLSFLIGSISCFNLLPPSSGKSKMNSFCAVIITNLLSSIFTPVVINDLIKCCKVFWWFYCDEKVDIILVDIVWFRFLVCTNYFHLLFELIILGVWLIVWLELRFWFLFRFFRFKVSTFYRFSLSVFCLLNFTLSAIDPPSGNFFVFLSVSIWSIILFYF